VLDELATIGEPVDRVLEVDLDGASAMPARAISSSSPNTASDFRQLYARFEQAPLHHAADSGDQDDEAGMQRPRRGAGLRVAALA
jgi:hypothetical protein